MWWKILLVYLLAACGLIFCLWRLSEVRRTGSPPVHPSRRGDSR